MFTRDAIAYEAIPLPDRHDLTADEMLKNAAVHYDFMKRRHTVRDFAITAVEREIIELCIRTAGTAPSGANHQPWHFVAISNPEMKHRIRTAAEEEEISFYKGKASDEWLKALEPIGTTANKPHLDVAPWLIVVFAQRYGTFSDGTRYTNYYVPESVGIATGLLISALHHSGLVTLTHTPNPMKFLNEMCDQPPSNKPIMIIAAGEPAANATVPKVAKIKKPLEEILTVIA